MPILDYLLIGTITADLFGEERLLGGTVSYSAFIAHLFGQRVGLLTSAAIGETVIEPLLDVAEVSLKLAKNTTTFSNIYDENGKRTQYVHAVSDKLTYESIPVGWLDTPLVHLAPLVDEVDTSIAKHFPDATVLLTPQGYLRRWGDDGQVHFKRWLDKDMLADVDIVVFSKADIYGAPDLEAEFAKASEHVIVTNGENGGTYYHHGEAIPYKAHPVEEVEPTGAGDVFAASLLSSLPKVNHDMQSAIKVAARLAGISVTRMGSRDTISSEEIQEAITLAQEK